LTTCLNQFFKFSLGSGVYTFSWVVLLDRLRDCVKKFNSMQNTTPSNSVRQPKNAV